MFGFTKMMCGILSLSGDYTNASILTNHPIDPVVAGSFFTLNQPYDSDTLDSFHQGQSLLRTSFL